jgi:hypothetical protein
MDTFVDEIDKLVPDDRKKAFTAKFFKDLKYLKILNKGLKNDFDNLQAVLKEILDICDNFSYYVDPKTKNIETLRGQLIRYYNCGGVKFTVENFGKDLAAFLKAYDDLYEQKDFITKGKSIGEMVDPIIKSLSGLNPKNWDKEFSAKLRKAIKNEDYRIIDVDDDNDNNDNVDNDVNDVSDDGGDGLYYFLAILLILIVVGIVVFLVLRHKRQVPSISL